MQNDIEETKNVYQDNKEWAHRINDTMNSMLEKMNEREEVTQKGKIQLCWLEYIKSVKESIIYFEKIQIFMKNKILFAIKTFLF